MTQPVTRPESLRRRLETSPFLIAAVARGVTLWLGLCRRTTRWRREGDDLLRAACARGPVVVLVWHECSVLAVPVWPPDCGPLTTLVDPSPAGRVSAAIQTQFGLRPVLAGARGRNPGAARAVLRRLAMGAPVALTGDGPEGPARVLKDAPLDWARASGAPVFLLACGSARRIRLRTWDRMIWPLPFTRGLAVWRPWPGDLPRRADPATRAALRAELGAALSALTDEVASRIAAGEG